MSLKLIIVSLRIITNYSKLEKWRNGSCMTEEFSITYSLASKIAVEKVDSDLLRKKPKNDKHILYQTIRY